GRVIGVTPSQSARNTLAAGVAESYNFAQFLGHLPGRRGARGPVAIGTGTLILIDEASMLSSPDLADLVRYAVASGPKAVRGGEPEQMMDAAATAYVALTAAGTDALLMAADHALRKELSRRIREDLLGLGLVQPGPAVTIADGTRASPGDLIACTCNDHATE